MLKKYFTHSFWCTRDTWSFLSLTLSQLAACFLQAIIIFATNFCELVHRKTFVLPTDCCFWKKDFKIKAERRRNHWSISENFLDLSTENRKFRTYCILSLFGQWNQLKEFPDQLALIRSKVHPLKRKIKYRQRICFLFVDWANLKFFFFVEEMFRV